VVELLVHHRGTGRTASLAQMTGSIPLKRTSEKPLLERPGLPLTLPLPLQQNLCYSAYHKSNWLKGEEPSRG